MVVNKIAIIGLGYVGLPLAVEFGKKYPTIGFDIDAKRIEELRCNEDRTLEVTSDELRSAQMLTFTNTQEHIKEANVYIVTVPTPIDNHRQPDLAPLIKASELLGQVIAKGDVVIYESTVYPGATEEDCIPVIEKVSALKFNKDFFAGYSPERINPGDKERPVSMIVKVTSGSTPEVADFVDELYKSIITVGTFKAASIKVAEASKIIENTQRDVNIALMNELSMIFDNLKICTNDVIEAAATKWNFIKLTPGLVGGHCIGVDPYYLVHKSMSVGHIPDIIRTAREINDGMPRYVASKLLKAMIASDIAIKGSNILVTGLTFKENCPDTRNTKVVELVNELQSYGMNVDIVDPWVDRSSLEAFTNINFVLEPKEGKYDAIVIAVAHKEFIELGSGVRRYGKENCAILDMKDALVNYDLGQIRM